MPLTGITVADFSQAMSGPTGTMLLGDFGAQIIKIEPPVGDNSRRWGFARYGQDGEFSSQFLALNRNKASICIDLKQRAGTELARKIIASCDIVIESFKPGVMSRLGLGYDELSLIHP